MGSRRRGNSGRFVRKSRVRRQTRDISSQQDQEPSQPGEHQREQREGENRFCHGEKNAMRPRAHGLAKCIHADSSRFVRRCLRVIHHDNRITHFLVGTLPPACERVRSFCCRSFALSRRALATQVVAKHPQTNESDGPQPVVCSACA